MLTDEMYAFVHLFRQQCPLFGLPETYAVISFYLQRHPFGKIGRRQQEKGQHHLEELLERLPMFSLKPDGHRLAYHQTMEKLPYGNRHICIMRILPMHPERTRYEHFIEYTTILKERFYRDGILAELQHLLQWVVWKGELENGKYKEVLYNPNYRLARASVKIPKSWKTLPASLKDIDPLCARFIIMSVCTRGSITNLPLRSISVRREQNLTNEFSEEG